MATPLALNDILRCTVYNLQAAQLGLNVLSYRVATVVGGGSTLEAAVSAIDTAVSTQYKAIMGTTASYRGIGLRRTFPGALTPEVFATLGQGAGLLTGDPLPKQICGILSKRTSHAGRTGRGRVYVPFPTESQSDTIGACTFGYSILLQALAVAILGPITVGTVTDNVQLKLGVPNRLWNSQYDCTQILDRQRWGTQRRRGDFGKTNVSPI